MSKETEEMKKADSYGSHYAEFVNVMPMPMNDSMANILFISTVPVPLIHNSEHIDNKDKVQVRIGINTQLQHSCSVTMPINQLEQLRDAIDRLLSNEE